jgi:hypothetical protein
MQNPSRESRRGRRPYSLLVPAPDRRSQANQREVRDGVEAADIPEAYRNRRHLGELGRACFSEWIRTFAIITTDSNELMVDIHAPMPVKASLTISGSQGTNRPKYPRRSAHLASTVLGNWIP